MDNMKPRWLDWCRLCANDATESKVIWTWKRELDMKQFFGFDPPDGVEMPANMCGDCNSFLSSFTKFDERVRKVEQMYTYLMQTPKDGTCDLRSIRRKFDVLHRYDHKQNGCTKDTTTEADPIATQDLQQEPLTVEEEGCAMSEAQCKKEPLDNDSSADETINTVADVHSFNTWYSTSEEETKQTKRRSTRKRKVLKYINPNVDDEERSDTRHDCNQKDKSDTMSDYNPSKDQTDSEAEAKVRADIFIKKEPKDVNRKMKDTSPRDYTMDAACAVCSQHFDRFSSYSEHMLASHVNNQWECSTCNRTLQSRYDFDRHLRKHLPKKSILKHICTICGLELSCSTTYIRHLSVHSDKMPFLCDHCGKAFRRDKNLKDHMVVHLGYKSFSCSFCDVKYNRYKNCRRHMIKVHPEEFNALKASRNKARSKPKS